MTKYLINTFLTRYNITRKMSLVNYITLLILIISSVIISSLSIGCDITPPLPSAPADTTSKINDTLYIPQNPVWTGFSEPSDIIIGAEPFIYIAEKGANRIAMLDIAGRLIGYSDYIARPTAISQDGMFDLLVCGELDTVINSKSVTIGAIYRISIRETLHDISRAPVRLVYSQPDRPERRFTGIAALDDNSYVVARTGPNNSSRLDPDEALIIISKTDTYQGRIASLTPEGNALNSIGGLSGVALARPRPSRDLIITQTGTAMQYRAQWLAYSTGDITGWAQKFNPAEVRNDFLTSGRFKRPEGACCDTRGNIFIVDAGTDSLYSFTATGKEQFSFGGSGNGTRQFNSPSAVAWFDRTLYVADTKNNRIMRYRLSTEQ
ncbi:hypothetical protein MASR2M18_03810 [Ignavibacteria bacterium]|nr:hypothetical protein [Bacteroidota bacterium]MCZ2133409.1 hypothetical protein [Bacteroidota bacterium]